MAERIPREESLRRVHGTGSLFSAAYGNVGSTPYYALGVTAAFALGLTPLAFVVAGVIFVCTAATYMEGTVMHPEAGGSANFARHAFNEMVSFVAGWGQMLNYCWRRPRCRGGDWWGRALRCLTCWRHDLRHRRQLH